MKGTNKGASGRNASMELLRILSMGMVMMLHFVSGTGALSTGELPLTPERTAGGLLEAFCIPAVDLYVLLSGYYLSRSRFRPGRLLSLYGTVWFYSAGIMVLGLLFGKRPGDGLYGLLTCLLPVSMKHYWFVTAYFGMAAAAPVLGMGVQRLRKRELQAVLGVMFLAACVLKSLLPVQLSTDSAGYDVFWFFCLFLLGGYFARFGAPLEKRRWLALAGYLAATAAAFCLYLLLRTLSLRTGGLLWYSGVMFHYNSITCCLQAVFLFSFFAGWTFPGNALGGRLEALVLSLSPLTFGVYLIHQHMLLRDTWFLPAKRLFSGLSFVPSALCAVAVSYAACLLLERLRREVFGRLAVPALERLGVCAKVRALDAWAAAEEEEMNRADPQ